MKTRNQRKVLVPVVVLAVASWVPQLAAQSRPDAGRHRAELSGLVGASGIGGDGGFVAIDGMWGIKFAGFSRNNRIGIEGSFEQSTREPGLLFGGGDFVLRFPLGGADARTLPFVHAGAGVLLFDGDSNPAFSFGGGIQHFFTRRVGFRFGVQDRMIFEDANFHRLDVYVGAVFRF